MASKDVLKHGSRYVPEINDAESSRFDAYETYSRKKIDEKLTDVSGSFCNWAGRKIVFEGDNLTANAAIGYPAYVADQMGATAATIGISGHAVYPNNAGAASDFRRRISNIPADADAIIILGDMNSGGQAVHGVDECYKTDPLLWAGRWNLAIDAIRRSFPTVPIILCTPWVGSRAAMRIHQARYVPEAFRHFSNLYGCSFINLATECPLNLMYAQSVWGLTATDQTQCSHEAMPLFADVIVRKLRQIPPFRWSGRDTIRIQESDVTVAAGSTAALTVTQTGDLSVRWTSSNMDVACVMGGVVYGMSPGTATVTATTRNGNTASCTVTVTA